LKDADALQVNAKSDACFQGQTHGHDGFLMPSDQARLLLSREPKNAAVLFPFLITDDLIGTHTGKPSRYVVDFGRRTIHQAQDFKILFNRIEARVLKDREAAAKKEKEQNDDALAADSNANIAKDHATALNKWWLLFRAREKMLSAIRARPRYIICGRVTRRPIFVFVHPEIHPNDSLAVFPLADDYSFGVLQSGLHWQWFNARCSTMKADWRYTSNTVFDSFPWPQEATVEAIKAVANASVKLREHRAALLAKHNLTLRDLYRLLEKPGSNEMKTLQEELDAAVRRAYGMPKDADPIAFLLELNHRVAAKEAANEVVVGPGLPSTIADPSEFITSDCLRV
jgi:hypothetical protein